MLELSHLVHTIVGVSVMAVSFGHIYLGTIGMEGAFEAMVTGECDENWAREHHNLWYDESKDSNQQEKAVAPGKPGQVTHSQGS